MSLPELVFDERNFLDAIKIDLDETSLIVADSFNYDRAKKLHNNVLKVDNNLDVNILTNIKNEEHKNVIAIGGCTTLDVGRVYALNSKLIVYPSILSTACISINRSVLANKFNRDYIIKTLSPIRSIINYDLIFDTSKENLRRWTFSGALDILTRLSATINFLYIQDSLSLLRLKSYLPSIFWFMEFINNYDAEDINREFISNVATLSHLTSIDVITRDDYCMSASGEHTLYHTMKEMFGYTEINPTHGELVAVGNIIAAKIFSLLTGDNWLFDYLKQIYARLDFPITYEFFLSIGISRDQLLSGLRAATNNEENSLFKSFFSENNVEIIDEIFDR